MRNTRIRVPETARAGESVEIRVMIMHPMENGFNYTPQGELIPVDIVTDFTCRYLGEDVITVRLAPGLSANPYFAFHLRATRSGPLEFTWIDQHGEVTSAQAELKVV